MKTFALSLLLAISSFMAFSQAGHTLSPTLHLQGKDTMFCFTIDQSKELAKELSAGDNCAEQVKEYDTEVKILDSLVLVKDRQVTLLKQENYNTEQMFSEQKKISDGRKADITSCESKLKHQKSISKVLLGLTLIFAAIAVIR